MKPILRRWSILVGVFFLFPGYAHAHSAGGSVNGWHDGFYHPLHGWDHLLAMLAVGIWAAQQRGRAVWLIPLTFVGVMCVGGIVGAAGASLPGVELAISISVVVFVALVARRVRLQPAASAFIVGFFAFFHGFAHGAEMPGTVSLLTFGLGFVTATLLLHGIGLLVGRIIAAALACLMGCSVFAQEATNSAASRPSTNDSPIVRLPEVIVEGRADSLIGMADSATQGTVGAKQLADRPVLRSGEVLETVPGVIITQHAGGGKANQYFLRGFNLDHGTDFATFLDGMPLNLPTHGHGQGYSDMNIVIPELVQRVNYEKGVYYAENGDFSSAGSARLDFFKVLPQTLALVEGGMYGFARGVFADSPKIGDGHLLYGIELYHDDGPWKQPDDYQKFNGMLTYSQGDDSGGFSITAHGYHGKWNSSDQVAESAITSGLIPFFGSLDNTTGGNSQRYSLQAEWHRADENSATKIMAYGFYYDLDLFSDFTYFLDDPVNGDQFEQQDRRVTGGLDASHTLFSQWGGREVENTFGLQFRNDDIRNGLFNTVSRQRLATTREDDILQTSAGLYYENKIRWSDKFRTDVGLRGDIFNFDVSNAQPLNSGTRSAAIASPKAGLVLGPWAQTEFYLQGGLGFHSNDGRGVMTHVDPVTGLPVDAAGDPIKPAKPLVQTYGAEVGARTSYIPGLQSSVALWWLDIDSELVFAGDAGTTEASRPSRRYGVEWANFYNLTKNLTVDADISFSHAEFRDDDPIGNHIPGSVESVVAAGITYHADNGFFATLRLRYFGPRPLIEDNSYRSSDTILVDAGLGWHLNKTWTVSANIYNLLDRRDHDIDYAYESRISPSAAPVTQVHFHPVEPIQVRCGLTARF